MKKLLVALLFASIAFLTLSSGVIAGGDKVRGENGLGDVNQCLVGASPVNPLLEPTDPTVTECPL